MVHTLLRARAACGLSAKWVQQAFEHNRTLANSQGAEISQITHFRASGVFLSLSSDWSGIAGKNGSSPRESRPLRVNCKGADSSNCPVAVWSETA
jgi:hypothetical protein